MHHRNLRPYALEPHDALYRATFDGPHAPQLESELDEELDRALAAQTASGWAAYLSRLEPHLAGGHLSEEQAHARGRIRHLYDGGFG